MDVTYMGYTYVTGGGDMEVTYMCHTEVTCVGLYGGYIQGLYRGYR